MNQKKGDGTFTSGYYEQVLMLNHICEEAVSNTVIMVFMLHRHYANYERVFRRLNQIFQQNNINFGIKLFVSDNEPALRRFGSLFRPEITLQCIFHFHQVRFMNYTYEYIHLCITKTRCLWCLYLYNLAYRGLFAYTYFSWWKQIWKQFWDFEKMKV